MMGLLLGKASFGAASARSHGVAAHGLTPRSMLMIAIALLCMFSYLFGGSADIDVALEYFDEKEARPFPFTLPERKYFMFPIVLLVGLHLILKTGIPKIRSNLLKAYLCFSLLMGISFVFDGGQALNYNIGFFVTILFVFFLHGFTSAELRLVLQVNAVALALFLLAKNYYFPPIEFGILARYGGGANPNNHAMYASLALILAFLFNGSGWQRLALLVPITAIAVFNLILTGSRTSFSALIIAALAIALVRFGARRMILVLVAITTVATLGLVLTPEEYLRYYVSREHSLDARASGTFITPLTAYLENYLIPFGPSAGRVMRAQYASALDSGYLWFLLSGGLIAFALIVGFMLGVLREALDRRVWHDIAPADRHAGTVARAVVVYAAIFMLLEGGLRHIMGWGDSIFLSAAMIVLTRSRRPRVLVRDISTAARN